MVSPESREVMSVIFAAFMREVATKGATTGYGCSLRNILEMLQKREKRCRGTKMQLQLDFEVDQRLFCGYHRHVHTEIGIRQRAPGRGRRSSK